MKYSIRSIFIAPKGSQFLSMDLKQAESYIVAFSAREENMKQALQHDDIHLLTASILFDKPKTEITKDERYVGKRFNHALAYRMSAERAYQVFNKDAQLSGVTLPLAQVKIYRDKWHDFYRIKEWWTSLENKLNHDRTLTTVYGRSRTFYGRWGDELFKEATAYIPQSTVSDHTNGYVQPELGIEGGLLGIHKWTKKNAGCRLVHQGHDSLMLEIPINREKEIAPEVVKLLKRPMMILGEIFTIPVDVDYGERFGELCKMEM